MSETKIFRPHKILPPCNQQEVHNWQYLAYSHGPYFGPNWARVRLNNQSSQALQLTDWVSEDGEDIPASAKINGITFSTGVHCEGGNNIQDVTVQLLKNGLLVGDNKASANLWPTAYSGDYNVYDDFSLIGAPVSIHTRPLIIGNQWSVYPTPSTDTDRWIYNPSTTCAVTGGTTSPWSNFSQYTWNNLAYPGVTNATINSFAYTEAPISGPGFGQKENIVCGCIVEPPIKSGLNQNTKFEFIFKYFDSNNYIAFRFVLDSNLVHLIKKQSGVETLVSTNAMSRYFGRNAFGVGITPSALAISVEYDINATYNIRLRVKWIGQKDDYQESFFFQEFTHLSAPRLGFFAEATEYSISDFYHVTKTVVGASVTGTRTFSARFYGNSADLWGTTWTATEINDSNFGLQYQVQNLTGTDQTGSISDMALLVNYSPVYNEVSLGGVVAGGSAVVTFYNSIEGDSGVVVGGEESLITALLGVTQGGVVCGGDAVVPVTVTTDGGVVVGGRGTFTYNEVASGGVVTSGIAYQQWYIPAQGGAVVGGDAYIQNYIVPQGGVVTGGQHEQTFIDYVDGTGGVVTGGNAIRADLRIKNYYPNGNIVIIGGEANAGITGVNLGSSGGVDIAGEAVPKMTFNLDLDILWNTRAAITKDMEFLWNMGQLPIYWYRIIGKGRQGDECNLIADPCCQKFIVNIHARTLAELCDKLRERRLNLPIESVQRFSRPAETDAEGADDPCNELEEVEICEIPRCAEFCVDFENSAQDQNVWGFSMFVQIDSFFDYEVTDGVFVSGSAGVSYTRNIPDFPHEAEGEITIGGIADVVSTAYSWEADGSIIISGEADRAQSNWLYVGGEYPTIIARQFSTDQESLADSTTDKIWNLVDQIAEDDGLYASSDISYAKTSEFLIARNFGFEVPVGSNITGLRVSVERFATQSGVRDVEVYLLVGDEIISDNLADTTNDWPVGVSFSPKVYGSNGYDGSGIAWSDEVLQVDDINNPEFGVAIRVNASLNTAPIIANVDYIAAKLFYEDPDHQKLRVSGSASVVSSNFTYIGDGAILVEGDADAVFTNEYDIIASGGVVTGGSLNTTEEVEPSGGAVWGGEAQVDPIWGEGGSSIGGSAKITPYIEDGTGGAVVGGKSLDSWDKHYEASGFVVVGGEAATPDNTYEYEASGGVVLGSDSDFVSSAWSWESNGNAIFILGGGGYKASDLGTFTEVGGFDMVVTNILATFQEDQHFGNAVGSTGNVNQCGCLSVPLTINLEHNFVRSNILAQFLRRNNLSLPSILRLNFNRSNTSWQTNHHYKGFSADSNTQETWDIVFELQCTSLMGSIEIGRNIWKLAIQFFRRNLNTGEDYDTRIIIGVLPESICGTNANELNFTVTYDTQSDAAVVDPAATIYQNSIYDNIGLFKKPNWIQNPDLIITVTQAGLDTPQTLVNVVGDVLNPDDRPVGYFNDGRSEGYISYDEFGNPLFLSTGPTVPPQLQNQN